MLRILKGKSITAVNDIRDLVVQFECIEVDIGTGDGRFVYVNAKKNPGTFYIGIDPVGENMFEYASKASQKPSKGGLSNLLYLIATVEDMPEALAGIADKIYVTLPWGSLLQGITKGVPSVMRNLSKIAKRNAQFEFLFTYDILHEAGEIEKRDLPLLNLDYIKTELANMYQSFGFSIEKVVLLSEKDLRSFQSTWAKRLGFGRMREIYAIKGTID